MHCQFVLDPEQTSSGNQAKINQDQKRLEFKLIFKHETFQLYDFFLSKLGLIFSCAGADFVKSL